MSVGAVSGFQTGGAAAIASSGRIVIAAELERFSRVRQQGFRETSATAFMAELAEAAGAGPQCLESLGVAESVEGYLTEPHVTFDHHFAHAATALLTTRAIDPLVLVCDGTEPGLSLWSTEQGRPSRLESQPWPVSPSRFLATIASCLRPDGSPYRLQVLASTARDVPALTTALRGALREPGPDRAVERIEAAARHAGAGEVAASAQQALAEELVALVKPFAVSIPCLCLAGGLFHNTYLNSRLAESAGFTDCVVPASVGNPGLAAGIALMLSGATSENRTPSPFLGPEYSDQAIKAVLDNCKLSYDFVSDEEVIDRTVAFLNQGLLVGWFRGRMEWGPRALGNRSILANPFHKFVGLNLNDYLKRRSPGRLYGVAVPRDDVARHFAGPPESPFMQFEYQPRDPHAFAEILPSAHSRLRVQTVGEDMPLMHRLLREFGRVSGIPAVVNTSFNGFHEPIVCSPRDAVRVFYGTGLDAAFIGNFLLCK